MSFILSKIYSKKPISMPAGPLVKWQMCWQQCRLHFLTVTSHGRTFFMGTRYTWIVQFGMVFFAFCVHYTTAYTTSSFDDTKTHFFRIKISAFNLIVASSSQLCVWAEEASTKKKKTCGMKIGSLPCSRPFRMHYIYTNKIESSRQNRIEFRGCSISQK